MDHITRARLELGIITAPCEDCRWGELDVSSRVCRHPLYVKNGDRPCSAKDNWQDFEDK